MTDQNYQLYVKLNNTYSEYVIYSMKWQTHESMNLFSNFATSK